MVDEILNQRGSRYGDFADNSEVSQILKNTLHTKSLVLTEPYIREAVDIN